jgi:hypothetical protein
MELIKIGIRWIKLDDGMNELEEKGVMIND